jgi:cytochrome P450
MAQDDTPEHWRDKAVMRAVLDREDIPLIRAWVAAEAARRLQAGGLRPGFEAVGGLTRGVPLALVQHWFGFADSNEAELRAWSYWNQMDAFWNQPFQQGVFGDPDTIVAQREAANARMRTYLVALITRRAGELRAGQGGDDVVSRLLRLSASGALRFDAGAVVLNTGGLLIGAVETTSHAAVNALEVILADPDRRAAAEAAARSDDLAAIDGHVFEALRFKPAFPYFFRIATEDSVLARGTDHEVKVSKGATVLAVSHSAMFDEAAVSAPEVFDPGRALTQTFTFGVGMHECLGRAIGAVMVPAIVREALRLEGLTTTPADRRGGPVPERWTWSWAS